MAPVEGATHFVPMEHPEVVREEIRQMILRQGPEVKGRRQGQSGSSTR
jgi:hypothetical protein